jgi:NMD protein affecting ribosome stability and mRNA decay
MSEKKTKKCGECGEEIKDGNYFTVWEKDKLVKTICKKCYLEDKKLDERIKMARRCRIRL